LVGLAPLYERRVGIAGVAAVREVMLLGTGVFTETSHYMDVIARRGYEQEVADSVANYLSSKRDWDRLQLQTVPLSSPVLEHLIARKCDQVFPEARPLSPLRVQASRD
jgi:hypothetical protein